MRRQGRLNLATRPLDLPNHGWRINAGAWNILAIPDTSTDLRYDVDEIVSRIVANG